MSNYSCGNCDECGGGLYKEHAEETKWFIGLDIDGQAHYICEKCEPGFFCTHPVTDFDSVTEVISKMETTQSRSTTSPALIRAELENITDEYDA